jgi:YgiT-type zinc finger domain-containing protein
MFNCHACHSEESHTKYINEIFKINGQFYLVENIPATVLVVVKKSLAVKPQKPFEPYYTINKNP